MGTDPPPVKTEPVRWQGMHLRPGPRPTPSDILLTGIALAIAIIVYFGSTAP